MNLPVWTVYGQWPETQERWLNWYEAPTAREAEDAAQRDADAAGGVLWVAGVVPGQHRNVDLYTLYVDPDAGGDDTLPAVPGIELAWYSVCGLMRDPGNPQWMRHEKGERWVEHIHAVSPRLAEDLAQETAREKHGVLEACAVFEGQLHRADTYARFVDPDMTTLAQF